MMRSSRSLEELQRVKCDDEHMYIVMIDQLVETDTSRLFCPSSNKQSYSGGLILTAGNHPLVKAACHSLPQPFCSCKAFQPSPQPFCFCKSLQSVSVMVTSNDESSSTCAADRFRAVQPCPRPNRPSTSQYRIERVEQVHATAGYGAGPTAFKTCSTCAMKARAIASKTGTHRMSDRWWKAGNLKGNPRHDSCACCDGF